MFKHYFAQIEGIEILPLFSLFLFLIFFALMLVWVITVNKSYLKHMEELPLEEDDDGKYAGNVNEKDGVNLDSNL